jgi:hypothetical protein
MTQDNLGDGQWFQEWRQEVIKQMKDNEIGSFSAPPIEGGKKRDEDLDKAFNEYKRRHDILLQDYNKRLIDNDEFDNRFAEVRTIYIDTIEEIWASDEYQWSSS